MVTQAEGQATQDQLIGIAYVAGRNARIANAPRSDNPFSQKTDQFDAWIDGWDRIDDRLPKPMATDG